MVASSKDPQLAAAQNPATATGALIVLAGTRPDLRPVIANNRNCSHELREWIKRTATNDKQQNSKNGDATVAGSWAPFGWAPADDRDGGTPFGSVLGDPLMGSPLFEISVLGDDPIQSGSRVSGAQKRGRPVNAAPMRGRKKSVARTVRKQQPVRAQQSVRGQRPVQRQPVLAQQSMRRQQPVQVQRVAGNRSSGRSSRGIMYYVVMALRILLQSLR